MANERVAEIYPRDLMRLNGAPLNEVDLVQSGLGMGVRLTKGDTSGYSFLVMIPAGLTVATGFTYTPIIVDDGSNAGDLGKVVRLGVTAKALASGTDDLTATGAATEATHDMTLDATTGQVVFTDLAIASASQDSLATGGMALITIRRIGTAAEDTCKGSVLLLGVKVRNT
jgi:hypothetical protein